MCDVFDSLTDGEHLTRNLPSRKHGLGGDGQSFTHSVSEALQERPVSTYLPLNEVEAPPGSATRWIAAEACFQDHARGP